MDEYWKVRSSTTEDTKNVPLYPILSNPEVFTVSVTFSTIIVSPTFRSCGSSEITVTVFDAREQVEMNLGFLL